MNMNDEKQIQACANMFSGMMCGAKLALAVALILKDRQTKNNAESFARIAKNLARITPGFIACANMLTKAVADDTCDTTKMAAAWETMEIYNAVVSIYMQLFTRHGDIEFTQEMIEDEMAREAANIVESATIVEQSETIQ